MSQDVVPASWQVLKETDGSRNLVVGIHVDESKLEYNIYLLDLFGAQTWHEKVSAGEVKERLHAQGYDELSDENIRELLRSLDTLVKTSKVKLFMSEQGRFIGEITEKLVDWKFLFSLYDSQKVLSQYILQQSSTISYLDFKYQQIKSLIAQKDHYIKYLTENYKAVNGDELIKKYQKNNPDIDQQLLNQFDESAWCDSINPTYEGDDVVDNLLNATKLGYMKTPNAKKEPEITERREAFDFSYSPKKKVTKSVRNQSTVEEPSPIKQEPETNSIKLEPETTIKLEPETDIKQEPDASPKRRKRQGMIRSKKKV